MNDSQITEILNQRSINNESWNKILPIVYQQLKSLARNVKFNHKSNEYLNTTALVHEAFLKMQKHQKLSIEGSRHFYLLAAQAMRQILVDFARKKIAKKRTQNDKPETDEDLMLKLESDVLSANEVIEIDFALDQLQKYDARMADIVINHFYGGYSFQQISDFLGISERTAIREWKKARAYIFAQLSTKEAHP